MREFVYITLTAILLTTSAFSGFVGWEAAAPIRGQLAAQYDLMRGYPQVLAFGHPTAWRPEYARLLRERYGIKMEVVAGCGVSESLIAYVEGYNQTTMRAVNRRFGYNVFEEIASDASRNWELQNTLR